MSEIKETAATLYQVLTGGDPGEPALAAVAAYFSDLHMPLDPDSFQHYIHLLQRALQHQPGLAAVARRWRVAGTTETGFSTAQAAAFLQDYINNLDPNLLFSQPITAGYARWDESRFREGFSFRIRAENTWSLLYSHTGSASIHAGARNLQLSPGTALLVSPGAAYTLHHANSASNHSDWGYYWAIFQAGSNWRSWMHWPQFASNIGFLKLTAAQQHVLQPVFASLVECFTPGARMRTELSHNLLEQLLLRFSLNLPIDFHAAIEPRILRAQQFIEQHFNENFSLADVARATNLSVSRLASLFRSETGLTVLGFRDEQRMVRAAQLLRGSSLDIATIGAEVGYDDPAYFSRTFSRHVGCSPRDYQRS